MGIDPWFVLVPAAALLSVTLWRLGAPARRAARARRAAVNGQGRARKILERAGYRILDEQVGGVSVTQVDGEAHRHHLRADFLVERDGRRAIADAKDGELAARISRAATRRQLLEYALAYDVQEVLLVDVRAESIACVRFPAIAPPRRFAFAAGALAGAILMLAAAISGGLDHVLRVVR
ncbi:MAG: hypothetical protein AAF411_17065 [Myxococcota bacterium]